MANSSEEFVNSTLVFLSSPNVKEYCVKESDYGYLFFHAITALCFLIGTPAHLWCLWIYFGTENKIKETQVFALNHIIMEIIYSLSCGMDILNVYVFNNDILWCAYNFFSSLSWTGRPLLQTCICIEQYLAVIHPVAFLRYKGIKYRVAATVAAWLIAFAYGVYEVKTLAFPDYFYTSVFVIALTVICFCCVSVLCALKQSGPGDNHITKQAGRNGGNQQKRNAFNTIFSALLLILFTYLPQVLLIFIDTGVNYLLYTCTISPLFFSLNVFGVIITPLLKLYKESKKKCLKYQKESQVTT